MTEITLQEAKHQIAKKVGFVHWQWNDLTIFTAPDIEEFEKNLDEAAELYASQYKTELSSKEALIGELKSALELAKTDIEAWAADYSIGEIDRTLLLEQNEAYQNILTALNKVK